MTPSSTGQLRPYSYDPVGNRLSSLGAATWSYNASNHLTSISGSPGTSFTYDANGRVAQASTKAASCTARSSATTLRRVPYVCGVGKRGYKTQLLARSHHRSSVRSIGTKTHACPTRKRGAPPARSILICQ